MLHNLDNYLIVVKILGKHIVYKENKLLKLLKKTVIFCLLSEFLDNETIYELKHVCRSLKKLVEKFRHIENKSMLYEVERIKMIYSVIIYF